VLIDAAVGQLLERVSILHPQNSRISSSASASVRAILPRR
jgi:hypothetical protein